MRALLRPLFVGALSVAIAATGLLGSSSAAVAATGPRITTWSVTTPVYEGDRPFANDSSGAVLTVTITLSDGLFATTRFVGVTVLNAAPSISSFAVSAASLEAGQSVTATGTFADNGAAD